MSCRIFLVYFLFFNLLWSAWFPPSYLEWFLHYCFRTQWFEKISRQIFKLQSWEGGSWGRVGCSNGGGGDSHCDKPTNSRRSWRREKQRRSWRCCPSSVPGAVAPAAGVGGAPDQIKTDSTWSLILAGWMCTARKMSWEWYFEHLHGNRATCTLLGGAVHAGWHLW